MVSVLVTSIITYDGTIGTIYPETTAVVTVYDYPSSPSLIGSYTDPGTLSSASTTVTLSQIPPTTSTAPAATASNEVHILLWTEVDLVNGGGSTQQWWLIVSPAGQNVEVCETLSDGTAAADVTGEGANQGYPGTDVSISFSAGGLTGHTYTGGGSDPGTLQVPGRLEPIACVRSSQFGEQLSCDGLASEVIVSPDVVCWF